MLDVTTIDAGASARESDGNARTPADLFRALCTEPRIAFLDGRAAVAHAPRSVLAWNPVRELRLDADAGMSIDGRRCAGADPFTALDDFLGAESAAGRTVIGALAYELGGVIEPRARGRQRAAMPLAVLTSYDRILGFDHRRGVWSSPPPRFAVRSLEACTVAGVRVSSEEAAYARRFARARRWIGAGDVYQVNLAIAFEGTVRGHPAVLYERLASGHPVPYGAYLDCGELQLLSNSPELFLERRGERIVTRPIKGTRPRSANAGEDARLREELRVDAKERAEHVMIVDLERSDLGRIGEIGSVRVGEREAVRTYPTLHHLESSIVTRIRRGLRFSEILRATFPGGSITGAPKIRAMQIIDELEDEPRGFYTGAVLHHSPDGDFTMSIAIRTATVHGGRIRYMAGGALVWDSIASQEYAECLLKARAFLEAAQSS